MGAYSLAEAEQQLERLVYEALAGEIVTIIRDGRPVVTLTPSAQTAACAPIDDEYREWMRKRREARPSLGGDAVTLIREMRDEER